MEINHSFIEGVLILKPEGDIDHHSAMDMLGSMRNIRDMYMPPRIMLDMSDVGFMDSSGIAVVTGAYRLAKETGSEFALCRPKPQPLKVLKAAGLDRIIKILLETE